jgi:ribose 1,5-bisphosphokinase PhnN
VALLDGQLVDRVGAKVEVLAQRAADRGREVGDLLEQPTGLVLHRATVTRREVGGELAGLVVQ